MTSQTNIFPYFGTKTAVNAFVVVFTLLFSSQAFAQKDSVLLDRIDLFKHYEYTVKRIEKQKTTPVFSDSNFLQKAFTYDLPLIGNRVANALISSSQHQFQKQPKSKSEVYSNYLLLGYATALNPFGEAYFSRKITPHWQVGLFALHNGDNQKTLDEPFFGSSTSQIKTMASYKSKQFALDAQFDFDNQNVYLRKDTFAGGPLMDRQKLDYQKSGLSLNVSQFSQHWIQHAFMRYQFLGERNKNKEHFIATGLQLGEAFFDTDLDWEIGAEFQFAEQDMDSLLYSNNMSLLRLEPKLKGTTSRLSYQFGLQAIWTWAEHHAAGKGISYLMPELHLSHKLNKKTSLSVGFFTEAYLNDFLRLQQQNPRLNPEGIETRAFVAPKVYAKLAGRFKQVDYNLYSSYSFDGTQAFFKTDSSQFSYSPFYYSSDKFEFLAQFNYDYTKKIGFNLNAHIQQFDLSQGLKASNTPFLKLDLGTSVQWTDEFFMYGKAKFWSKQNMLTLNDS
ncbi:MAG: hypothetical protein ACPG4W_07440, partial [Flavobacteriales bacterium]